MNSLPIATQRQTWAELRRLLHQHPTTATLVATTGLISGILGLSAPYAVGRIVHHLQHNTATTTTITTWGAIAVTGTLLAIATSWVTFLLSRTWGEQLAQTLRDNLTHGALNMSMRTLEETPTGELPSRATTDTSTVTDVLQNSVPFFTIMVINMVVYTIGIIIVAPIMTPLIIATYVTCGTVGHWYKKRANPAYLAERTIEATMANTITENATGARTTEAFTATTTRNNLINHHATENHRARMRTLWLRTMLYPTSDASIQIGNALLLTIGGLLVIGGHLELAALATASGFMLRLGDPFAWLLETIDALENGRAALARIIGVSLTPPAPPATTKTPHNNTLQLTNVTFTYTPNHPPALHNINLTIHPGERIAIVGPSGSGKTTLGRLIAGFDHPTTGTVHIGNVPVADLPTHQLARNVLMVTQEHHIFTGPLRDNLTLANPHATDTELTTALHTAGTDLTRFPDGLNTHVGVGGLETDGALAQHIALARMLLAQPHVVVLDEATSLLSPTDAQHTEQDLNAALAGRTIIAIAHRLHTAYDADRIIVVENGHITEQGPHDELLHQGGSYATLWHTWHGHTPPHQ